MSLQTITTITAIPVPDGMTTEQVQALNTFSVKGLDAMNKVSRLTELPAELTEKERDIVVKVFNRNATAAIRRYCRQLREKMMLEGDQMPIAMVLDSAKVKGVTMQATAQECVMEDNEGQLSVPASRVPVHPSVHAGGKVPAGIDLVSLTIGACTRWTGTQVAVTLPVDTLNRFQMVHVSPAAIKDVVADIPHPETKNGMRGRRWAYEVYSRLAKLPPIQYYEFANEWYQSLYKLPPPGAKLDTVRAGIFALTKLPNTKTVYIPKDGFKSLPALAELRGGFPTVTTLPAMYGQYVEFASIQQGEGSGVGMAATSLGSWGLSGTTQVTCERMTAFIVASQYTKIVLLGLPYADVMWIHQSVKKIRSDQMVFEYVSTLDASDALYKTSDVKGSLFIKIGSTQLYASASANKINNIKVYDPAVVLPRVWTETVAFLEKEMGAAQQVFYGAFLPPENDEKYQYVAMHRIIWNTCGFVMARGTQIKVSRYVYDDATKKIERKTMPVGASFSEGFAHCITDPLAWYKQFSLSMNGAMTLWALPRVNNDFGYFNHMAPYNTSGRYRARQVYNAQEDDYYVVYDEVIEKGDVHLASTSSALATTVPIVADTTNDPAAVQPDVVNFDALWT